MSIETENQNFQRGGWWRHIITLSLVILVLALPISAMAGTQSSAQPSKAFLERQMNAAQQLKEYRDQMSRFDKGTRGTDAARKEVEIKINSEAKTSSSIFFYDNFEGGLNGFTTVAYSASDVWHQSTIKSTSTSHSWWPGIELQENSANGSRIKAALIAP